MDKYEKSTVKFTGIKSRWGKSRWGKSQWDKPKLRKTLISKRDNIENRAGKSAVICQKFLEKDYYKIARNIMAYSSIKSEVETNLLIEKMISDGKTVILPVSVPDTKEIIPIKIENIKELRKAAYGILEPAEKSQIFNKNLIDLVIVPAVSYDRGNYRIGYGAGYYDRFLKDFHGLKIGFCFNELFYNGNFPITVQDIPVDEIIS
jgi:5-formyltetrahydrofolate cyclo-ligase